MKGRGGGRLCGSKPGLYILLVSFIQDQILFHISGAAADLLTLHSVSDPSVLLDLRKLSLNQHSSLFPMEKLQCSNELLIYRRKSQWQNSADCFRSTREREVPLKYEIPLGSVGVKDSFLQAGSFSSQLPSCMVFLGDTTWELCRRDNMVLCQLIFPGIFPWAWRAENMWRSRREDLALCIFLKS